MADDQLSMRAVVTDGFTGPLAKLRNEMRSVGNITTGRAMDKDWANVEKRIKSVGSALNYSVGPALRGIGIGSLGVGAAISGAILGLRGFATSTRDMAMFAREIGMSVQKLREVKVLGEFFGVSWDSAKESLTSFADTMDQMHRRVGAYGQLRGMDLADLAESLRSSPDMATAFNRTLDAIKKLPNEARQRDVARIMLGSAQWAVIAREMTPKLQKQIAEMLKALPQGSKEAADQFAIDMLKIQLLLENLRTQGFAPILPEVSRFLELLAGDGKTGESFVMREAKGIAKALHDITDAIEMIKRGDWGKLLELDHVVVPGGPVDKMTRGSLRGPQGSIEYSKDRLSQIDAEIAASKQSGYSTGLLEMQRKQLIEEIEKLRKTLEDANKSGAVLQQQSYTGRSFGGARIMNASLNGGGGFGGFAGNGSGARSGAAMGNFSDPGAGLAGSDYLKAQRAPLAGEIAKTPGLREKLSGMLMLEGTPHETMESLANRTVMMNKSRTERGLPPMSLQQMLFSGFYGPLNRGQLPGAIRQLSRNPALAKKLSDAIDATVGGSNLLKGATDQGMPSDPNGQWAGGGFRLRKGGNIFNDWGGGPGHDYARRFREEQQRAVHGEASSSIMGRAIPMPRPAPSEIRGNASIDINFNNLPGGSKIRSDFGGMFREINIHRGRPMQSVWDNQGAA